MTLVTPAGVPVHADLTNADGIVKLPALPRVIAIVDRGGDVAAVDSGETGAAWNVGGTLARPAADEPAPTEPPPPAAFHVTLEPHVANPAPGARLVFELAAAPDSSVEWTLRTRRHALAFDDFAFGQPPPDAGEITADGTGATDAQGHLTIVTRDPATPDYPVDYIVTATVRDAGDHSATAIAQVTAHPAPLYLGTRIAERVLPAGVPFDVELAAFAPDGARRTAQAALSLIRLERTCEQCAEQELAVLDREVDLAARSHDVEQLLPPDPGVYRLRVTAPDALPLVVDLWVTGTGETRHASDGLVASKDVYRGGDTARLAIGADLAEPTILLTLEHDNTVDARVFHLANAAEGLEVVVARSWAPAVTARVVMLSGGAHPHVATASTVLHVVGAAVD